MYTPRSRRSRSASRCRSLLQESHTCCRRPRAKESRITPEIACRYRACVSTRRRAAIRHNGGHARGLCPLPRHRLHARGASGGNTESRRHARAPMKKPARVRPSGRNSECFCGARKRLRAGGHWRKRAVQRTAHAYNTPSSCRRESSPLSTTSAGSASNNGKSVLGSSMALSRQSETCQRKPPRSAQETRSTPQGCGFKYVAGVLDATRDGAAPAARRASAPRPCRVSRAFGPPARRCPRTRSASRPQCLLRSGARTRSARRPGG